MHDFLKTVTHPNRRALAERILAGTPVEELYEEYGNIRVIEMQNSIARFCSLQKGRRQKKRGIDNAGCRACRRNPGTCN